MQHQFLLKENILQKNGLILGHSVIINLWKNWPNRRFPRRFHDVFRGDFRGGLWLKHLLKNLNAWPRFCDVFAAIFTTNDFKTATDRFRKRFYKSPWRILCSGLKGGVGPRPAGSRTALSFNLAIVFTQFLAEKNCAGSLIEYEVFDADKRYISREFSTLQERRNVLRYSFNKTQSWNVTVLWFTVIGAGKTLRYRSGNAIIDHLLKSSLFEKSCCSKMLKKGLEKSVKNCVLTDYWPWVLCQQIH